MAARRSCRLTDRYVRNPCCKIYATACRWQVLPGPTMGLTASSQVGCRQTEGQGVGTLTEPSAFSPGEPLEVLPIVVLSKTFPARPSSIPEIREFVRRSLAES